MKPPVNILETDFTWTTTLARIARAAQILHSLEGELKKEVRSVIDEITVPFNYPYVEEAKQAFGSIVSFHPFANITVKANFNYIIIRFEQADVVPEWFKMIGQAVPSILEAQIEGFKRLERDEPSVGVMEQVEKDIEKSFKIPSAFGELVGLHDENNLSTTLSERGSRYGEWNENAKLSQVLKEVMWLHNKEGWKGLKPFQKEGLEMIVQKIARIINGDPDYLDNWHDISGYATLCENHIKAQQ